MSERKRYTIEYISGGRESFNALDYRVTDKSIVFKINAGHERILTKSKIKRIHQWKEVTRAV